MNEEKLKIVLPLMFRQVRAPQGAKEALRQRLFGVKELSDDELFFVAAAGSPEEQNRQKNEHKI